MNDDIGFIPPHNLDAEHSTLGACLIDGRAVATALRHVGPADFYRGAHSKVFAAMAGLNRRGEPVDLITLSNALEAAGLLEEVGGVEFLLGLQDTVPTAANVEHYAKIVKGAAVRRTAILACTNGVNSLVEHDDAQTAITQIVAALQAIRQEDAVVRAEHIGALLWDKLAKAEAGSPTYRNEIRTGFPPLTRVWQKLRPGYVVSICARTGEGKSTLANQITRNVAMSGPVVYWSGECPREVLVERLLGAEALVCGETLLRATPDEIQRLLPSLRSGVSRLEGLPIWVMDETIPGTLENIEETVRWVTEQEGRPVVQLVIDRLELLVARFGGNATEAAKFLVEGIKRMAMRLRLIVVLIQQPNWDRKNQPGRKPRLTDLAYGNTTAQCSQAVIFLNNAGYDEDGHAKTGCTESHVLKCSDDKTGVYPIHFVAEIPAFFATESEYLRLLREDVDVPLEMLV